MEFAAYVQDGRAGLAATDGSRPFHGLSLEDPRSPGDLLTLLQQGGDALAQAGRLLLDAGAPIRLEDVILHPPIRNPGKIICIGLNYADHSAESGFKQPEYPAVFARFASSLVGHQAAIVRPSVSEQLDYEGEVVAVIGKAGRAIERAAALDHVAGYSLFNDASVRDYQFKSQQWTVGKNFDGTGAFGPVFVTAEGLPSGCKGLRLKTRLNGMVVQDASLDDLVFDVATLVSLLSVPFALEPGDIIVTGTPAGVGLARTPPLWMKPGDVCEVEVQGIGTLRNPIIDEGSAPAFQP
ncbi:fumarylacetoacetate hydrolase family protein [Lichenicoccus sp.]|uniref:fumarylacetoacetate hydrolase family protein n=1 Tax=Lichenicoccus sp. TaxID=2781899 RepID=UPI003D12D9F3